MRVWALVKRIALQMIRDKRTLALLFLAPLLVLTLMYFLFNGDSVEPRLGTVGIDDEMADVLEDADFKLTSYEEGSDDIVIDNNLHGLLEMHEDGELELTLKNDNPSTAKSIEMMVKQALSTMAQKQLMEKAGSNNMDQPSIKSDYIYGDSDTEYFDVLSPVLVGFFVFFFVFLISGIGLLRERTSGTLERMMSTPIRRAEIVTAYLIGYGLFAVIQTIIVVVYSINVLDMVLVGSVWNVMFINLLLALVALSIGILLSTFAASEFQMMQFIPIVVIPQVFFAGIFPLEGMADWLQVLGKVMPIYYAADALKGVMYKGFSLGEVSGDLLALVIFAAIFITLNIFALKKYRRL